MPADPIIPLDSDQRRPDHAPPLLAALPSHQSGNSRHLLSMVLSLCLGLFLVDAAISLLDDSLLLFFQRHPVSGLRAVISLLTMVVSVGIYALMGLTPRVPKRLFLPIAFFNLAALLVVVPFAMYCYDRLPQVAWAISGCQVGLALLILSLAQGGFRCRWPLVPEAQLGGQRFTWRNLSVFVLANLFGLLPAVLIYLWACSALAVAHFSEGFMALRPGGFTVQVRKYVRADGKMIELFPMAHVADAGFYRQVSRTFPTNSIILMEGVTDSQNLLTNKISYARMAKTLGLAEQHESFEPTRGVMVRADVDVAQFSADTIGLLNLVMLVHAKGVNAENLTQLLQYSPSPEMLDRLLDDLLRKRNTHLLAEIQSHLSQSDSLMVPWGAAHMPGLARAIQKSGFRLEESRDYVVIRFAGSSHRSDDTTPTGNN